MLGLSIICMMCLACNSTEDTTLTDGDMDGNIDDDAEGEFFVPETFTVFVSPDAPPALLIAAQYAADYLTQMGKSATLEKTKEAPSCAAGEGAVLLPGDGLDNDPDLGADATDQTFSMQETRCGDGVLVTLSGGGLKGRQYAVYEWLHALGVRFFHPEQEYIPSSPDWPLEPLSYTHTPAFKWRSVSLHLTHPLELGDAFRLGIEEYIPEAARYIDWQIKNGASDGHGGVGSGDYASYGFDKGFPRSAGFSLYNQQQGGNGLIDPDDPRSMDQQITDAIDERMGDDPNNYPEFFGFTFNPTEFTEMDDEVVVHQLTLIADYIAQNYPGVTPIAINHGTYGEPTEHYKVRYYNLPQFAPENLAVKVHTLMFYDLFRPAPMYGNTDFSFLYDFMEQEYQKRQLWYFPESAWWLTFDNQLPFYLPITIEARDRDIQGIKHMLAGKLEGHHVFGTGHEWGYWQNEYCSFRMSMDTDYRYTDCLTDIVYPMGTAGDTVKSVMEDAIIQQEGEWIYGDILRYLVGTDPETEAADSLGIQFHPLPPSPKEIMSWTAEQVDSWLNTEGAQLQAADAGYTELIDRLDAVRAQVPEAGLPWFNEIYDGLAINGLRARHQYNVYAAIVTYRKSQIELSTELETSAKTLLSAAKEATQDALAVIHRREQSYRYQPIERSIGGGPNCNEDSNWSSYSYRVHCRTHTAYYFTRIDELVEEIMLTPGKALAFEDVVVPVGEPVVFSVIDANVGSVAVDFGDGETDRGSAFSHVFMNSGLYTITVTPAGGGDAIAEVQVAILDSETVTGFTGKVNEPDGIDIIEPVMPSIAFGRAYGRAILGFSAYATGEVQPGDFTALNAPTDEQPGFAGIIETLQVPIIQKSDHSIIAHVVIGSASAGQVDATSPLLVSGNMATESVVESVVVVGGGAFDEEGARKLIASFLGFTPDTLPSSVPFVISYDFAQRE
jgi:hypothetical protein